MRSESIFLASHLLCPSIVALVVFVVARYTSTMLLLCSEIIFAELGKRESLFDLELPPKDPEMKADSGFAELLVSRCTTPGPLRD